MNIVTHFNAKFQPTTLTGKCICLWLLTVCFCLNANSALAQLPSTDSTTAAVATPLNEDDETIKKLVQQLDAPSFKERESASKSLVKIGGPVLRELAVNALDASPESTWRTKKTLEMIGTQGNQDLFYKSVGILQVLFTNQSKSLDSRIVEMEIKWKDEKRRTAIKRLQAKGAEISLLPVRGVNPFMVQRIIIDGRVQNNLRPQEIPEKPVARKTQVRTAELDSDSTAKQIDKILLASLEENRELVLRSRQVEKIPTKEVDLNQLNQNDLHLMMLQRSVETQPDSSSQSVTVKLGEKWQGNAADLKDLKYLDVVNRLELFSVQLDSEELDELSRLPMVRSLRIEGDSISDQQLSELAKISSLGELELIGRKVGNETMEIFVPAEKLANVSFANCTLSGECFAPLSKLTGLRSLFLSEMQIAPEVFGSMHDLKTVDYINLSVCKFETKAYRELVKSRPNLNIVFTAQAFLGVRGPTTYPTPEKCEISEVIDGSGAAEGGMQVGDVVKKVNGQAIATFEDLRLHIAQHKSGETLKLAVQRNGKPVDLTIKLTEYDQNLR